VKDIEGRKPINKNALGPSMDQARLTLHSEWVINNS